MARERKTQRTLGIDEAGRGPVLGPLVLCGVCIEDDRIAALSALEVRDSKAYGSTAAGKQRRAELAAQIHELAAVRVEIAEPAEIDRWNGLGGLNQLEQALAARVIEDLDQPERIVADGYRLFSPLAARYPQLEAKDRADATEVCVAAASIVAKDERDRRLEALLAPAQAELGPIGGGGYPNAQTAQYLRAFVARHGQLPPGLRLCWSWSVLLELREQLEGPPSEQLGLLGAAGG